MTLMVAYGVGVDSTGMLCGMAEMGINPDAILFADTGGEKPGTYAYLSIVRDWLASRNMTPLITVQNDGSQPTLEGSCLENHQLPSIVFGRRACSEKYKQRPQHKWAKRWQPAIECWKSGGKVRKAIGYDAGEIHRAHIRNDDFYTYWYPLIEWGWTRADCIDAIKRCGLPVPTKSACFYCPSSTKREVLALAEHNPELLARAVAMERGAKENMETVKGLGRHWSWEKLVNHDRSLPVLWDDPQQFPCVCLGEVNEGEGIDNDE